MEANVQSMAAKADLLRVLADQSLSMDEKVRECTTTARRHHMGVASLGRIAQDVTSKALPETDVEGLVKHLVACLGEKDVAALSLKNADEDDIDREADEIEKEDPKVLDTQTGSVQHSTPSLSRNNPETEMPAPGQMETDGREVDTELRPTKESATLHPEETTETASQSVSALNGNEASQPALLAILTEEIKSLRSLFVEFSVEMADREVRYTRTVDTLSRKVVCLEDKVQELQKKLTKTLEIQSSKIGVLTTLVRSQTSPANSSPPASGSPGPSHPTPTTLESNRKQPPPQTANRLETLQPNDSAKKDLAGNETRSLLSETNNASTCASRDPKPQQHTPPSTRQEYSTSSTTDLTAPAWKTLRGQARPPQTQTHSSISQTKKELTGSARLEKAVFFLGGISSDCQLDSVLNYCKERNVRVASCRFLPSRIFGTKSARLCVSAADAQAQGIINGNFWPEHLSIRPWHFTGETVSNGV